MSRILKIVAIAFVFFQTVFAQSLSGKTFLVTGGCGFIGSHLVDRLINEGASVVIIDDLSYGKKEYCHSKAVFFKGDVCDKQLLSSIFDKYHFDGCYHLAAVSSVLKSNEEWDATHRTNSNGAVNVFNIASKHKSPVVYASSAAVYGDSNKVRQEDDPVFPQSGYAVDKYTTELNAKIAYKIHGNSSIGLRFFNVYGPRQDSSPYSGVIAIYIKHILKGAPLRIDGDGGQTRDFIYISDIVEALYRAMKKLTFDKFEGAEVINVCTGQSTSLNDLVQSLQKLSSQPLHVTHAPERKGDIRYLVGDRSKLFKILDYVPQVSLVKGLKSTYSYFNEKYFKLNK